MNNSEIFESELKRYAAKNGFGYVKREGKNLTLNGEILKHGDDLNVVFISDKADLRRPKGWLDFTYCYVCTKNSKGYLTLAAGNHEFADPADYLVIAKKIVEEK